MRVYPQRCFYVRVVHLLLKHRNRNARIDKLRSKAVAESVKPTVLFWYA